MANITDIRMSFRADSADLSKIAALFHLGGEEQPDAVSLNGEEEDKELMDPQIEMQVDDLLVITGTHNWGIYGYTFCQMVSRLRDQIPSLRQVKTEQIDTLLDYYEIDLWDIEQVGWYQTRIMMVEYANGILFGVHHVIEQAEKTGSKIPPDREYELQLEALRSAYNQSAEHGWFGFNVERTPLHG